MAAAVAQPAASRETELAETFPAHVVCEWIGNSQRVAAKHYLSVTADHFRKAGVEDASESKGPAEAVQKAVQYAAAEPRNETQGSGKACPVNDATPAGSEGLRRGAAPDENDSEPQGGPDWT